jgi:hypothetical protein
VGVLFHRRARRRAQQNDGPGRAARNLHRKSAATWRRRQRTPFPRPGPTPLSERRARMRVLGQGEIIRGMIMRAADTTQNASVCAYLCSTTWVL